MHVKQKMGLLVLERMCQLLLLFHH